MAAIGVEKSCSSAYPKLTMRASSHARPTNCIESGWPWSLRPTGTTMPGMPMFDVGGEPKAAPSAAVSLSLKSDVLPGYRTASTPLLSR